MSPFVNHRRAFRHPDGTQAIAEFDQVRKSLSFLDADSFELFDQFDEILDRRAADLFLVKMQVPLGEWEPIPQAAPVATGYKPPPRQCSRHVPLKLSSFTDSSE